MNEFNFDTISLPKGEGYECKVVTLCQDGIYREVPEGKPNCRRELRLTMLLKSDNPSPKNEVNPNCDVGKIIAQNRNTSRFRSICFLL